MLLLCSVVFHAIPLRAGMEDKRALRPRICKGCRGTLRRTVRKPKRSVVQGAAVKPTGKDPSCYTERDDRVNTTNMQACQHCLVQEHQHSTAENCCFHPTWNFLEFRLLVWGFVWLFCSMPQDKFSKALCDKSFDQKTFGTPPTHKQYENCTITLYKRTRGKWSQLKTARSRPAGRDWR